MKTKHISAAARMRARTYTNYRLIVIGQTDRVQIKTLPAGITYGDASAAWALENTRQAAFPAAIRCDVMLTGLASDGGHTILRRTLKHI